MSPRIFRTLGAAAAAVTLLASLTACASAPMGSTALTSQVEADMAAPGLAEFPGIARTTDATGGTGASPVAERSVITTATLSIEVADPEVAVKDASRVAEEFGWSVASLNVYQYGSGSGADLTLRIPSAQLDDAVAALGAIGEVSAESRNAQDVTTQHVDLQARVAALEVAVDRLQQFMATASSTSDLLAAESALSVRQQELDGLRAQLASLTDQVDEATLFVSFASPSTLPGGGPSTFWDGLLAGISSLGTAGAAALVVLGVLLPWLVLAGIIALAVVLIVRRARRRRATHPTNPSVVQAISQSEQHY